MVANYTYRKYQTGFTIMEAVVSIIITLIGAFFISYSMVRGINLYKSINFKRLATEKLIEYTDEYRTMVAYGEQFQSGVQPRNGHDVVLYNPKWEFENINFNGRDGVLEAKLYHKIERLETIGDISKVFNIQTWIVWNEEQIFNFSKEKHLAFEVTQAVLIDE